MSTNNRFLDLGGNNTTDLFDGTANLYVNSIKIAGLVPNEPLATDNLNNIISTTNISAPSNITINANTGAGIVNVVASQLQLNGTAIAGNKAYVSLRGNAQNFQNATGLYLFSQIVNNLNFTYNSNVLTVIFSGAYLVSYVVQCRITNTPYPNQFSGSCFVSRNGSQFNVSDPTRSDFSSTGGEYFMTMTNTTILNLTAGDTVSLNYMIFGTTFELFVQNANLVLTNIASQ